MVALFLFIYLFVDMCTLMGVGYGGGVRARCKGGVVRGGGVCVGMYLCTCVCVYVSEASV